MEATGLLSDQPTKQETEPSQLSAAEYRFHMQNKYLLLQD